MYFPVVSPKQENNPLNDPLSRIMPIFIMQFKNYAIVKKYAIFNLHVLCAASLYWPV